MKAQPVALLGIIALSLGMTSAAVQARPQPTNNSSPCHKGGGRIVNNGTMTLSNCTVSGNSTTGPGGGIANEGTLTLNNVVIKNNTGGDGGGLYNNGTLTATNVKFVRNSTPNGDGGAIYNVGTATLNGVTFSGNSASKGDGGAIYNESGTIELRGLPNHAGISVLSVNSARDGGAIYNSGGTVEIVDSIIASNHADDGAGVYDQRGTTEVQDAAIVGNVAASDGGGFYEDGGSLCCGTLDGASPYAANFTLAKNRAGGDGGGIYNVGGSVQVMGATISDNTAKSAGGGLAAIGRSSSTELKAVLLARNTPTNCNLGASLITDGYNLDTGRSCGFKPAPAGTDLVNVGAGKVGLGHLTTLGRFLKAEELLPGSPAIDAIPRAACIEGTKAASAAFDRDELDTARPQGTGCDIGAIERRVRRA